MHASNVLIALALGYLVLAQASKEKETIKILGQVIGIVVIFTAAVGLVCISTKYVKRGLCSTGGYDSMCAKQGGMDASMCPVMGKAGGMSAVKQPKADTKS